jgi:hypothetical protein
MPCLDRYGRVGGNFESRRPGSKPGEGASSFEFDVAWGGGFQPTRCYARSFVAYCAPLRPPWGWVRVLESASCARWCADALQVRAAGMRLSREFRAIAKEHAALAACRSTHAPPPPLIAFLPAKPPSRHPTQEATSRGAARRPPKPHHQLSRPDLRVANPQPSPSSCAMSAPASPIRSATDRFRSGERNFHPDL